MMPMTSMAEPISRLRALGEAASAERSGNEPAEVRLENLSKTYAGNSAAVPAVADVTLRIRAGEFFSLLGPSGCGKTTTLRMIAGFERPSSGRITIAGRDITNVPVHRRDIGMVFQTYALFPHRTVAQNVAFGLKMRRRPASEIKERVEHTLAMVALADFADRYPHELSGGQQQRVALARAIVIEPPLLLCDEPLGALDKKLRQQMQFELKSLQRRLGVTLVCVTHDQEEALAMSDRIGVMSAGRLEQVGSPLEIYDRPRSRFVADFIGDTNLIEGRIAARRGPDVKLATEDGLDLVVRAPEIVDGEGRILIALRPEKIRLLNGDADLDNQVRGSIDSANFQGGNILYRIALRSGRLLLAEVPNDGSSPVLQPGTPVEAGWQMGDAVVLEA
jgi:putative spermidine/putrescine transport system ATP-binding protein